MASERTKTAQLLFAENWTPSIQLIVAFACCKIFGLLPSSVACAFNVHAAGTTSLNSCRIE
jgi:hypothetical protein